MLERRDLNFQQDGASINSAHDVRIWLDQTFHQNWIGRFAENH